MEGPKLCYIDGNKAFFTTQMLWDQWGDDWDDAPYQFNAGGPYTPCWHREDGGQCECSACERDWNSDGTPKWCIIEIFFEGDFQTPADRGEKVSVLDINSGYFPWLVAVDPKSRERKAIWAGTPLKEFVKEVRACGGKIFLDPDDLCWLSD